MSMSICPTIKLENLLTIPMNVTTIDPKNGTKESFSLESGALVDCYTSSFFFSFFFFFFTLANSIELLFFI